MSIRINRELIGNQISKMVLIGHAVDRCDLCMAIRLVLSCLLWLG